MSGRRLAPRVQLLISSHRNGLSSRWYQVNYQQGPAVPTQTLETTALCCHFRYRLPPLPVLHHFQTRTKIGVSVRVSRYRSKSLICRRSTLDVKDIAEYIKYRTYMPSDQWHSPSGDGGLHSQHTAMFSRINLYLVLGDTQMIKA